MMTKQRELLLGHLLGALGEQDELGIEGELKKDSSLRNNLAELKAEIMPILDAYVRYEPPQGLAKRTCKNLWRKIDETTVSEDTNEVNNNKVNNKTNNTINTTVPPSPHLRLSLGVSLLEEVESLPCSTSSSISSCSLHSSQISSFVDAQERPLPRPHYPERLSSAKAQGWRKRDLFVSVSVGFLLAAFLFPAARMAIDHAKNSIYQRKIQEFSQKMPTFGDLDESYYQTETKSTAKDSEIDPAIVPLPVVNVVQQPLLINQRYYLMTHLLSGKGLDQMSLETTCLSFPWVADNKNISSNSCESFPRQIPVLIFEHPITPVNFPSNLPRPSSLSRPLPVE